MNQHMDCYDEEALLQRLTAGLLKRPKEVVFLVGAPLTSPIIAGSPGVPSVDGVIGLIRKEFEDDQSELRAFDKETVNLGAKKYQAAFAFLQGRRGQTTANEIIRKAVLGSRMPGALEIPIDPSSQFAIESACQTLDIDNKGWHLNTGAEQLGRLISSYPETFGRVILTTNFDPLIEVAVNRAGGVCWRTSLYSDGNLGQAQATGCHVVHLHGFWHGTDTLHTPQQLRQPRPYLKDSLRSLLREKVIVVCAYGGWDDIFTSALMELVRDVTECPEILWTFYSSDPDPEDAVKQQLMPGINRGRVVLYSGVDCNRFFPRLHERWSTLQPTTHTAPALQSNPVHVPVGLSEEIKRQKEKPIVIEGDDVDRPPRVDICVGRETEIDLLKKSYAKVVFITGIGGQGKSTLAAQYFASSQDDGKYPLFVWRDCKEESERFENQLASIVEKLSEGKISGEDLGRQSGASIVEMFFSSLVNKKALFTFDNVDHYVDLETGSMTGTPDLLVKRLIESHSECQVVFTCRPATFYDHGGALSIRLEGLSLNATIQLFSKRNAPSSPLEIEEAHQITNGHAFWLDLLAIQVVRQVSSTDLRTILSRIEKGSEFLPEQTLRSIWTTLHSREQAVLRSMAETPKPATEMEIGDYLHGELTYQKVTKALKKLRVLNLVVVKQRENSLDVLELHPMVKHFIRTSFPARERLSYINRILAVYARFIGIHKLQLKQRPSFLMLQHWTDSAELEIAADKFDEAFSILAEVAKPFQGSAYPREFTRTVRRLLDACDWTTNYDQYKQFERVFRHYVRFLADLGEIAEVDQVLENYEITIQNKDWRFIGYCDLRCYSKWIRGEFETAIRWGKKGQELKNKSDVDIKTNISHTLALAERDAGRPDAALNTFLQGKSLSEVTDPEELDENSTGDSYGNIGRCLHLMGQLDGAFSCYQKSALLLEKDPEQHIVNQGYIRAWVGQLLLGKGQTELAIVFLRAAFLKWQQTAPPRAERVQQVLNGLIKGAGQTEKLDNQKIENTCLDWILGKNLDTRS